MKTNIKGFFSFPISMSSSYRLSFIVSSLFIALTLSSCNLAYRHVLGVDTSPNLVTKSQVEKAFKNYKIPDNQAYILDRKTYTQAIIQRADSQVKAFSTISVLSSTDSLALKKIKENLKNDGQPVQIRYFKNSGAPIFKLLNCFIDPPIPMNWNVDSCLDVFPPKMLPELKDEHNDDLPFFLFHFKTLKGESVTIKDLPEADYYAIVMWNSFLKKPSRKLLKQIKAYDKRFENQHTHFLFVNNHNAVLWPQFKKEERDEIIKSGILNK